MNRQAGHPLINVNQLIHIFYIKLRVHSLGKHIQGKCYYIHITGPFTIAKESSFHPFPSRHEAKLCGGDGTASIVMRMQAQDNGIPIRNFVAEPLYLIGINIRTCHLHRCRQVDNHFIIRIRLPDILYGFTYLKGKLQLSSGKAFRGIFINIFRFRGSCRLISYTFCPKDRKLNYFFFAHMKDCPALQSGCGVIQMNNRLPGSPYRLKGFFDQTLPGRCQYLDQDIIGDQILFD